VGIVELAALICSAFSGLWGLHLPAESFYGISAARKSEAGGREMGTLTLIVAAITFGGAALGLILKHAMPEKMTHGAPRDAVASVVGLLTLLCALVLGLLVWQAYGVYSNQNATIQNYALRVLMEDLALADYGPEAAPAREGLRDGLEHTLKDLWGPRFTDDFITVNYRAAISALRSGQFFLDTLEPSTESQKAALAAASQAQAASAQMRVQMALALTNPISYPLIAIVVAWVAVLLCGYGFMSRVSVVSIVALALGALAVSSAVYTIIELSDPYSGPFRASPAPIERLLQDIRNNETH
jgi:hypothetical protein